MRKVLISICVGFVITACSPTNNATDNYVGTWLLDTNSGTGTSLKPNEKVEVTISNSGNLYLIKDAVNPTAADNIMNMMCPTGATIKDSKLSCSENFAFAYDANSGKLLSPLGTFSREK